MKNKPFNSKSFGIVIQMSEDFYSKDVEERLIKCGIRVEIDDRQEKIGYKIREAQLKKIPYMLIIGEKEVMENAVGVRKRSEGDIGQMSASEFEEMVIKEIDEKK